MSRENRDGAGNNTRPHGCGTEVRKSRTSGLARARYSSKWGVPRPGNHVQPGAGDTVREERGVGGGVEEVVRAVHDDGGCADVRGDLPCVVPVAGRQVAPLGMRGHSGSPRVRYGPGFAAGRPGVYINSSKARRAAPGPVRTNDLRTSSVRSTACGPPGDVHPSTRARTRSGCRAASCWVTRPPMDVPYTSARPMERASSTAIMSRANSPVL